MSDPAFVPTPALGGYRARIGQIAIEEVTGLAIVSLAVPRGAGGLAALNAAMQDAYGTDFPAPGRVTVAAGAATRFLGLAPDQAMAICADDDLYADRAMRARLCDTAYCSLQSDNWLALRVSGPTVRAALERICQIDLHPDAFPEDWVARTVMAHMGAVILRQGAEGFLLLSAWSSARSFLRAVETSAEHVA